MKGAAVVFKLEYYTHFKLTGTISVFIYVVALFAIGTFWCSFAPNLPNMHADLCL